MSPRIVIVGAGISGLALAFRLQERLPDAEIVILEQSDRPGGTTWTIRDNGFQVEIGPNGFLDTKPTHARTLPNARARVDPGERGGGQEPLSFPGRAIASRCPAVSARFVTSDLLSWRGKLSLLWERFRKQRTDTSDESIDAFARRRAGDEAAEIFADALVTGIYAGDPKRLSLPACFPRIAAMEREHGSVMSGFAAAAKKRKADARARGVPDERPGKMWSLANGLRGLIEALTARLKQPPIYGIRSIQLARSASKGQTPMARHADAEQAWDADVVVLTCPAHSPGDVARRD